MQRIITIRDALAMEAYPEGDSPHILFQREGKPGSVRIHLNEVR